MKIVLPVHVSCATREGKERKFHSSIPEKRDGRRTLRRVYRLDATVEIPDLSSSDAPVGIRVLDRNSGVRSYERRVWNGRSWGGHGHALGPAALYDHFKRGTYVQPDAEPWPWAEPTDCRITPIPTPEEANVVAFEDSKIVERTLADVMERAPDMLLFVDGVMHARRPPPLYDFHTLTSPVRVLEVRADDSGWGAPVHPFDGEWLSDRVDRMRDLIEVDDPSPYRGDWSVERVRDRAVTGHMKSMAAWMRRNSYPELSERCHDTREAIEDGAPVDPLPLLREISNVLSEHEGASLIGELEARAEFVTALVERTGASPALDALSFAP